MKHNIENAILSAFLFANDTGEDLSHVFKLDISVFSTKYRQRVAEQINNVTDGFYGYLMTIIEEKSMGTSFEQEYIDVISQNSMTLDMAKKYYDKLVEDKRMEELI